MPKQIKILHIEDNLAELHLVQQACEEANLAVKLVTVRDGEEAIKYLRKENGFHNGVRPDIMLLDLNLPKKNGFEVLNVVKNDPVLKNIPVFIFTGSDSKDDVFKAYQLHANGYIRKPNHFADYITFFTRLTEFCSNSFVLSEC